MWQHSKKSTKSLKVFVLRYYIDKMISISFSSHIRTKYYFHIGNGYYQCEIISITSSITVFFFFLLFLLNKNMSFWCGLIDPILHDDNRQYHLYYVGLNGTIIMSITYLLKRYYSNNSTHGSCQVSCEAIQRPL